MKDGKFDLSNVGGQPKDWAQREHEKELSGGIGAKAWTHFAIVVVCSLVVVASLVVLGLRVFR